MFKKAWEALNSNEIQMGTRGDIRMLAIPGALAAIFLALQGIK